MIKTLQDISDATTPVLKAYLKSENVPFSDGALKEELIAKARGHLGVQLGNEKPEEKAVVKEAEKVAEVLPMDMPVADALQTLQAKGFANKEELITYLNVVERDKAQARVQLATLKQAENAMEVREQTMKDREEALLKDAEALHINLKKQADLYDRIYELKQTFPSGVDTNL